MLTKYTKDRIISTSSISEGEFTTFIETETENRTPIQIFLLMKELEIYFRNSKISPAKFRDRKIAQEILY